MMKTFICMYVTLAPVIFAGVLNMLWCALPVMKFLKAPIDFGVTLNDGNRLFGDNKTWKGLFGYIILNCVSSVLWGLAAASSDFIFSHNMLYFSNRNTIFFNLASGLLLGLAYAVFELPNSFFKRRLGIVPGKTIRGIKQIFFVLLDQSDSIFGCVLVVALFSKMSVALYFAYVAVGAGTHIVINFLLYLVHLRKNPI